MNCTPNRMTNAPAAMQPAEGSAVPGLGDVAPDFTAMTTDGIKSLSDYRGQWVILFSHPGDFTPVIETQSYTPFDFSRFGR